MKIIAMENPRTALVEVARDEWSDLKEIVRNRYLPMPNREFQVGDEISRADLEKGASLMHYARAIIDAAESIRKDLDVIIADRLNVENEPTEQVE